MDSSALSNFTLSIRSRIALKLVHPDLVAVAQSAITLSTVNFRVVCGARRFADQRALLDAGKTKTFRSRHVPAENESGLAEAIDIAPVSMMKTKMAFSLVALAFTVASYRLDIPIKWRQPDHFELDWKTKRRSSPVHRPGRK